MNVTSVPNMEYYLHPNMVKKVPYVEMRFFNRAAMGRARFIIYPWFILLLTARPWAERGSCFTRGFFFFFRRFVGYQTQTSLGQTSNDATYGVYSLMGRYMWTLKWIIHVSTSRLEQTAIYLFQKTSYSPCGTFLFRTKLIFALNACAE